MSPQFEPAAAAKKSKRILPWPSPSSGGGLFLRAGSELKVRSTGDSEYVAQKRYHRRLENFMETTLPEIMKLTRSQGGQSLDELSRQAPTLVVFLRHGGCPFCRETLADVELQRNTIEAAGNQIALVHMMSDDQARELFQNYKLDDLPRFSDPEQRAYRAFGLQRGNVSQVMGPRIWWRGFKATILARHGFGKPAGDVFQLPGTFLISDGQIMRQFIPKDSADRPNLLDLAECDGSDACKI